jgi:hypothetical protein
VNDSDIVFGIGILYEYFISWYDLRHSGKLGEYSFIEILNAFTSQHGIQINESERLNGVIGRSCGEIINNTASLKADQKLHILVLLKSCQFTIMI